MIEFFRHALGLCGEPHPNILYFVFGFGGIGVTVKYCWCWIKQLFNKKHTCNHE